MLVFHMWVYTKGSVRCHHGNVGLLLRVNYIDVGGLSGKVISEVMELL